MSTLHEQQPVTAIAEEEAPANPMKRLILVLVGILVLTGGIIGAMYAAGMFSDDSDVDPNSIDANQNAGGTVAGGGDGKKTKVAGDKADAGDVGGKDEDAQQGGGTPDKGTETTTKDRLKAIAKTTSFRIGMAIVALTVIAVVALVVVHLTRPDGLLLTDHAAVTQQERLNAWRQKVQDTKWQMTGSSAGFIATGLIGAGVFLLFVGIIAKVKGDVDEGRFAYYSKPAIPIVVGIILALLGGAALFMVVTQFASASVITYIPGVVAVLCLSALTFSLVNDKQSAFVSSAKGKAFCAILGVLAAVALAAFGVMSFSLPLSKL